MRDSRAVAVAVAVAGSAKGSGAALDSPSVSGSWCVTAGFGAAGVFPAPGRRAPGAIPRPLTSGSGGAGLGAAACGSGAGVPSAPAWRCLLGAGASSRLRRCRVPFLRVRAWPPRPERRLPLPQVPAVPPFSSRAAWPAVAMPSPCGRCGGRRRCWCGRRGFLCAGALRAAGNAETCHGLRCRPGLQVRWPSPLVASPPARLRPSVPRPRRGRRAPRIPLQPRPWRAT